MGIVRPLMQASLLLAVMLFSACTGGKDPEPPAPSKTYTLTVRADKGSDAETRALSIDDGGKIIGEWATTDHVYVKKGNTWCTGYIQPQYAGTSTTLSGTISGVEIAVKDQLLLQFPRQTIDYTGQDGTLQTIAESYDYSSATATVTSVDDGQVSADAVTFSNQQAIVKFNLRTTSGTAIQASSLKIAAAGLKTSDGATGELTITPASPTAEIYAALSGISNATITLTATVGSETYRYERAGVTFANGRYYPITVKMKSHEEQQLGQPLTLEPTEDDTQITFINNAEGPVEFSRNLTNWVQIGSGESRNITVDAGNQVYFRGNNATYYPDSEPSLISCTAPCYVYGNGLRDPRHPDRAQHLPPPVRGQRKHHQPSAEESAAAGNDTAAQLLPQYVLGLHVTHRGSHAAGDGPQSQLLSGHVRGLQRTGTREMPCHKPLAY